MIQTEFVFGEEDKARVRGQSDRVLEALRERSHSTIELLDIGPRPAAYVHTLKQRGYQIEAEKVDGIAVYTLVGYSPMVEVSPEMQQAYYETQHWKEKRHERMYYDSYRCCFCRSNSDLQVHHWAYDLFNEDIEDLMTLCGTCHTRIHSYDNVLVHFPRSVTPEVAAQFSSPTHPGAPR